MIDIDAHFLAQGEHNIDIVFEAFVGRSEILKEVDIQFLKLQNLKLAKDRNKLLKEISRNISNFTNIKNVTIVLNKGVLNAAVIPRYTNIFPKLSKPKALQDKTIKEIQESAEHIEGINISIGDSLLTTFTNREITAILLHELGHVFAHNSYFSSLFTFFMKGIVTTGLTISLINPIVFASLLIPSWIVTRTLTIRDHLGEYDADKFAAKYGYGEEIISVMHKFHKLNNPNDQTSKSWIMKILKVIKSILIPGSHPPDDSRICKLARDMQKEYKDRYPTFRDEITLALSDVQCPV